MRQDVENNGFRWINVQKPTREEVASISQEFHFHELNIEDSLSKIQIPKIDRYESHVFVILHFPIAGRDKFPRSGQFAAYIGNGYLVTVHQGDLKPLVELFEKCAGSSEARQELMGTSAGFLFHSIVDALTDDLLNLVRMIVGSIDDIEDIVFDEKVEAAKEISYVRRQITVLRRIAIPLRRTLAELTAKDIKRFSDQDLAPYYDDVNDHVDKAIDSIEESKETIEIYKDTDFMHGTDRANKILAVLTIIFTLSIPLTIASSLYGMNVDIPVAGEQAQLLGEYTTFIAVVAASGATAFAMMLYFRRIKWI